MLWKYLFECLSSAIAENRVATVQALSGTGALRVGAEFIAKHYGKVIFGF